MTLLLVAGMHRSGTSFLTELLHLLGAGVGQDLLPAAEDNPHGFWERTDVKRINDQVLERLGGSWDSPPTPMAPSWAASAGLDRLRQDAEGVLLELAEESPDAATIAVKDPRLSLTGPFWSSISRPDASFVLVRDPDQVAESLRHRNGMSRRRSLDLWTRYTVDAVLDLPRPCLVSLAALGSDPESTLARVAAHAGLEGDLGPAIDLARERSRTWEPPELLASSEDTDGLAGGLHAMLTGADTDAEAVRPVLAAVGRTWRGPGDDLALERVRHVHGDEAVGDLVATSRRRAAELEDRLSDVRLLLEEARRDRDQERRARRTLEGRVSTLEEARDRAESRRETLEHERDAAREKAEEARTAATRSDAALGKVRSQLVTTEGLLGEVQGTAARLEGELADGAGDDDALEELERLKGRRSVKAALGAAETIRPVFRTVRRVRKRARRWSSGGSRPRGGDRGDDTPDGAADAGPAPPVTTPATPRAQPAADDPDERDSPPREPRIDWLRTARRLKLAPALTVVVPIHDAVDDVRACVDRLLAWTPRQFRIVLIDDASTDPAVGELLATVNPRTNVTVWRNEANLGFTRTVNRAFDELDGDVVILNSDARVTPNWTVNLRVAAYATERVATVSAVSDNAGAFSVPEPGPNESTGLAEVDHARLLTRTSRRRWVQAPTGHGFCMLVRREALDELGGFDADAFPRGYGEENDFCMRATAAGFVNVVDDATLVFHANAASFSPARKEELVAAGRATVDQRHPDYTERIRTWLRGDMQLVRTDVRELDVVARALANNGGGPGDARVRPRLLSVVQRGAGGTPSTNEDLMRALEDRWDPWILTSDSRHLRLYHVVDGSIELVEKVDMGTRVGFNTPTNPTWLAFALRVLVTHGIEQVHVRHLVKHSQQDLPDLLRTLGLPAVLSFHDFYWVCPNVHLLDQDNVFCGGTCTSTDGDCSRVYPGEPIDRQLKHDWVLGWQRRSRRMLDAFDGFVTTSASARDVLVDNLPELAGRDFAVIAHGRDLGDAPVVVIPPDPERIRIAVLGSLTPAKGGDVLRDLLAADHDKVLDVHVIGPHRPQYEDLRATFHGPYEREQLSAVLDKVQPPFAAVLSVWPETWSHTLTEAWAHGLPVLTSHHGALGERVEEHGGGWVIDVDDPARALAQVRAIAADLDGWRAQQERATVEDLSTTADMAAAYDRAYARASRRTPPPVPVVDVHVVTDERGHSPGSAHVRSLARFAHPEVCRRLRSRRNRLGVADGDRLGPVDVMWIQRNAVAPDDVDLLLARRDERGARLVVDLDDDLVHTEQLPTHMADYVPVMQRLVAEADVVTASTPALATVLGPFCRRVVVLPNLLDEGMWFPGGHAAGLRAPRPDGALDVLYMGTTTHRADLEFLREAFRRFADAHDGTVTLHVIGGTPDDDEWFTRIDVPARMRRYPRFVPWLRGMSDRFDVAVAPLLDTPFNASKSDLKFLEYSGMGLPSVLSRVPAYAETVTHGTDGRLADNTVQDWVANLHAVAAPDHRRDIAAAAVEHARRRTLGPTMPDFAALVVGPRWS